ncbi:hypothetical protein E4U43_005830, partial [Claviceps pusilla]
MPLPTGRMWAALGLVATVSVEGNVGESQTAGVVVAINEGVLRGSAWRRIPGRLCSVWEAEGEVT